MWMFYLPLAMIAPMPIDPTQLREIEARLERNRNPSRSACCNAAMTVANSGEGTHYYICRTCDMPCDPNVPQLAHDGPREELCGDGEEIEKLHKPILEICRGRKWLVVYHNPTKRPTCEEGVPDFVIAADRGTVFWIECKAGSAKATPKQQEWLLLLKARGHRAYLVKSVEQFLEIVNSP